MVDVRTLIFSMALGNLAFALLVWIYSRSSKQSNPYLNIWQLAKVVAGCGYFLGWLRPLLPVSLQIYVQAGNVMQVLGIGMELAAYCAFLGVPHWRQRVGVPLFAGVSVFALSFIFGADQHTTIALGTGLAGMTYLAMGVVMLRNPHRDPALTRVMGAFDCLVATLLLSKVVMGFVAMTLVPYAANGINALIYTTAFAVLLTNGFGFLLLTKQDDDRSLRRMVDELTQADADQRQFISMLSHEVRSPLAVIGATTELLAVHLREQPQHQPLLQRVQRSVARLSNFFDSCLTQDRVFSRNYTLTPVDVNVAELIRLAREGAEALSDAHQLFIDLPAEPIVVSGDSVLLRIVLMNLLLNAFKFSPAGSSVTVRLVRLDAHCRITVEDQGPGVPEKDRTVVFQKYRRGGAAERMPGAGLGLAIVKSIVDLHHGSAHVETAPGGGALFVVELPCKPTSA
ncbi:MAG: HAMP domain-containing histidine kinase [Rhodoferax sp.]|nr:HAMP domain-containing histidine kinase [Rhodoferax sp.]